VVYVLGDWVDPLRSRKPHRAWRANGGGAPILVFHHFKGSMGGDHGVSVVWVSLSRPLFHLGEAGISIAPKRAVARPVCAKHTAMHHTGASRTSRRPIPLLPKSGASCRLGCSNHTTVAGQRCFRTPTIRLLGLIAMTQISK